MIFSILLILALTFAPAPAVVADDAVAETTDPRPARAGEASATLVQDQDPASVQAILNLLNARDEQIKSILGPEGTEYTTEQRNRLKEIINGIIDFSRMARYALDTTFDTISSSQQTEFVSLFASIIRDQSLNKLDIYRAKIRYDSVRVDGVQARVSTLAEYDQVRTPVSYAMWQGPEGWVITDMVIDDVSTAESYRRQFQSIIRQRGFEALLGSLRRRAERIADAPAAPPI